MTSKPEICLRIAADLRASAPRVVGVTGTNGRVRVGHFPDATQVIAGEVVFCATDLFALGEEPRVYRGPRYIALFAQLRPTPQQVGDAPARALLFILADAPPQAVV